MALEAIINAFMTFLAINVFSSLRLLFEWVSNARTIVQIHEKQSASKLPTWRPEAELMSPNYIVVSISIFSGELLSPAHNVVSIFLSSHHYLSDQLVTSTCLIIQ